MAKSMRVGGCMAAVGLLAGLASGQTFNIDFGLPGQAPSASFGAAGVSGLWNVPNFEQAAPSMLTPVSGPFAGVWITTGSFIRESVELPVPGASGDAGALLNDGIWGTGDVLTPMHVEHLTPGRYKVIMYGVNGMSAFQKTMMEVSNPLQGRWVGATVGGAWTGLWIEGVTHASFGLNVPDGKIDVSVAGGVWGQSGFCNGMQIIKVCNADFTTGAIQGTPGWGVPNGALNNDDFFYYLDRFASGDGGEADLTTTAMPGSTGYGMPNGVISNDDFFYYLNLFAGGC